MLHEATEAPSPRPSGVRGQSRGCTSGGNSAEPVSLGLIDGGNCCVHKLGVFFLGILVIRALLFEVYIGAPDIWKLPDVNRGVLSGFLRPNESGSRDDHVKDPYHRVLGVHQYKLIGP